MDTRQKIVSLDEALRCVAEREERAVFVVGYFDPVTAAHARRLRELATACETMIAVVEEGDRPLLPRGARAELVAGLAAVDFVVPSAASDLPAGAKIISELDADIARRDALMARVRSRA